ncbi:RNA polymerase sigma factor RpoD/SigA [Treponema sp.]|uniref:sigma-70 family RNA polymerase sigma factor n=1 Tax=Treponema sp. TaxID=166 RepID=UPI00298E0E9F|nr:RNA polymerase sigma factor RpoD/SigA [Treponema sp.]MCR5613864.1 RNA polymerase sigma factor RpoD/SigA [Treponema sp.]
MKYDDEVLAMYLKEINKIPLLSHEEETELALEAQKGSKAAKDKIVNANLRFVVNVAKKYQNRGLDLTDLISEGNIGLMTAVDRFDVSKGYHFISYAVWWIRQSITKAISEKASSVRLPLNRINELNQIQKAKKLVGHNKTEEQEIREIGEMLNLEPSHIRDMLNISRDFISLDAPLTTGDKGVTSVGDFIEDNRYGNPDEEVMYSSMKDDIDGVLGTLNTNEQRVIRMRYGLDGDKPMSLKEIGDVCNLTKERIRQIEKHAIVRLQHPTRMRRLESYVA